MTSDIMRFRWRTMLAKGRLRVTARWLARLGLALLGVFVAYAVVGTLLSLVTVNRHPVSGGDVTVYLVDNGIHADIVVPVKEGCVDWSEVVPPGDTASGVRGSWLAFGWGSRDFYLNVPEWSDLTPGVAIRAISGTGGTALHATYCSEPIIGAGCRRLQLSAGQYDALVKYILAGGNRNAAGCFVRIPHNGYGWNDAFYEGNGRYSPFFTCNTWVNSALKACGQRCCLWTALSAPIFWKYSAADMASGR